jgi:hypothetical protein
MTQAESILYKYIDEKFSLNDYERMSMLLFAKEIVELSFEAGHNYAISLIDGWAKDYPSMTEHINNLFNKQQD